MTNLLRTAFVTAALLAGSQAAQASVSINFDAVPVGDLVNGFYNGGTSGSGATGPNLGVNFTGFRTTTGFGETSEPNLGFNNAGPALIDVAAGFGSTFSFAAGFFGPGTITIFSNLGGTGTLLATLSGTLGNTAAFQPISISFAGTAQSVVVNGTPGSLGFDDLVFGAAVPEPASWAMLIAGFGLVGAMMRRRQALVAA